MTNQNQRLPEKYYARRRVAALVAILVVIALIIWGLVAWGGSQDEEPEPATTSAPLSTTEETAPPTPTESEEETPESPYPESSTEAAPAGATCTAQDLEVTASSDQPNYGAGVQPTFHMTVVNPTDSECVVNLDENVLRFEVYDLDSYERVWSDTDCYPAMEDGEQTFEPNSESYFEAVWSRTASAPGECEDRPAVDSGGYLLHAVVGDNASQGTTFNLV